MFGPSTPPVFNTGIAQLAGPQLAGQLEPLLQMGQIFLPLVMPQLQQQSGFMPQLFSTQNMLSQIRAQAFMQQSAIVNQQSQQLTAQQLFNVMNGAARMTSPTGTTTAAQQQQMQQMAQTAAPFVNAFSTMLPSQIADALYGNAGNPTRLSQQLLLTGQNMYDPVTGNRGLSGDSAAAIGSRVYSRLYGNGGVSRMLGTGTAELSDLLDNLKQRGLLGERRSLSDIAQELPSISTADSGFQDMVRRTQQADATAGRAATSEADVMRTYNEMRRLSTAMDPASMQELRRFASTSAGQEILRTGDADRIAMKLKGYNEALVAIRDIFGDSGNPNAPVSELMATLDALTQGGLTTGSPTDIARSVRTTYALGRMNNFSMPVIQGLMAQASAQAQAAGLDPALSVNISQNAMAFGASTSIDRFMNNRGFGSFNREKLLLTEMNLQTQAAASPTAQRLGAIVAMRAQGVELSPKLRQIADDIMAGKPINATVQDLSEGAVMRELQSAGMSTPFALNYLRNQQLSQEYISKYDIGERVRADLQPQAVRDMVSRRITRALGGNQKFAQDYARNMIELGAEAGDYEKGKTARLARVGSLLAGMNTADQDKMMSLLRITNRAELPEKLDQFLFNEIQKDRDVISRFGTVGGFFEYFNPKTAEARAATEREAVGRAALENALAPLGRGNAISRLVQTLTQVGRGGTIPDASTLIKNALGVLDESDVTKTLGAGAGKAYGVALRIAGEASGIASDPSKRQEFKEKVDVVEALTRGTDVSTQLKKQEEKLKQMQLGGATNEEIEAQKNVVEALSFINSSRVGGETVGIGALIENSNLLPQSTISSVQARSKLYDYIAKHGSDAQKKYTREDLQSMTSTEVSSLLSDLETSATGDAAKGELSQLKQELSAAASASPGTAQAGSSQVSVKFPEQLKINGSVKITEDGRMNFSEDTYGSGDPGVSPPAEMPV
jgi:hypothetical protein